MQARRSWYEPDADPSSEELIAEQYRGIRPAFGYPACPDHSEKRTLFALLGAEEAGLALTESFAMTPASRVQRDQVEDYAGRKGVSVEEAERWLRPNLAYDPTG